jgi:hypothetical protein
MLNRTPPPPPFRLALPGCSRLRHLQPLIDGDGGCTLVYDVERAAVVEVPEELRFHVAPALETGDPDEELLGWLSSEDLLTGEGSWDLGPPSGAFLPRARAGAAGASVEARWGRGAPWQGGEEAHGWIDQPEPAAAVAAVDRVFKHGLGTARVRLYLDWLGAFPAGDLFETVVIEAGRRAMASGQEAWCELALGSDQVTVEVARRIAAHPVRVRLRCGEYDPLTRLGTGLEDRPWMLAEPAVKLLLPLVPRLTVQCMLPGPTRLIELWRWAASVGVSSLDAIRLEDVEDAAGGAPSSMPGGVRAREYRQDLLAIHEETCAHLEAGRAPVDFQPLTRIVRRLRRGDAAGSDGRADEVGVRGAGGRFARMESLDPRLLSEPMWQRLEELARHPGHDAATGASAGDATEVGAAAELPCQSCWARRVCSHSVFVASVLGKEDPRDASRERCAFWVAEVETAARLFHRLAQIDAIRVDRFLEEVPAAQPSAWPRPRGGWASSTPKPS